MKKAIMLILTIIMCFAAFGCAEEKDAVQNIAISGVVHASFESTVTINGREPATGGEAAVFKSTIEPGDIKLTAALYGKKVKEVKFIDKNTIEVVIDGKVELEYDSAYGCITISANALENDTDAFDLVSVKKATITAHDTLSSSASGTYSAMLTLSAGTFSETVTKENVTIAKDSDGVISQVYIKDGELFVEVTGASKCPQVVIAAEVTSFNKEVTISLAVMSSVVVE